MQIIQCLSEINHEMCSISVAPITELSALNKSSRRILRVSTEYTFAYNFIYTYVSAVLLTLYEEILCCLLSFAKHMDFFITQVKLLKN